MNIRFSNNNVDGVSRTRRSPAPSDVIRRFVRFVNFDKFCKRSVFTIPRLVIVKEWISSSRLLFSYSTLKMLSGCWWPSLNVIWQTITILIWWVRKWISTSWKIFSNRRHRTSLSISKNTKWKSLHWPSIGSWLSSSRACLSKVSYAFGIVSCWKEPRYYFVWHWRYWFTIERIFSFEPIRYRWSNKSKIPPRVASILILCSK